MYSGFCECSKGKNCGPCDHKISVAKHYNECWFSVIPETDPHMRAMWHYIAFGKTLRHHWYRSLNGEEQIDLESFINERLEDNEEEMEYENEENYEYEDMEQESESNTDVFRKKQMLRKLLKTSKVFGRIMLTKLSRSFKITPRIPTSSKQ